MNSIINAASSVSEAIWGKSPASANASGEEPPNETPATTDPGSDAAAPYDPGNTIDTAPAATTTAPSHDNKGDGTPTAIPAPGNAEQNVVSPTDGAGPTKTEEPDVAKKEEVATTSPTAVAAETKEKKEEEKKDEGEEQGTPSKKTAAAAATPPRGRSDSPSGTPGSGKRGLRTKLKEKLHIGSQSPSGRKKD